MTTERELLEHAAKACGISGEWEREADIIQERYHFVIPYECHGMMSGVVWNPLTNSADCAAMCANLGINSEWDIQAELIICDTSNSSGYIRTEMFINHNNDREAAWRYAATQVAAKSGGMK